MPPAPARVVTPEVVIHYRVKDAWPHWVWSVVKFPHTKAMTEWVAHWGEEFDWKRVD